MTYFIFDPDSRLKSLIQGQLSKKTCGYSNSPNLHPEYGSQGHIPLIQGQTQKVYFEHYHYSPKGLKKVPLRGTVSDTTNHREICSGYRARKEVTFFNVFP